MKASNVKLGVGDPERFSLLGGSFGEAGDVVLLSGTSAAARYVPRPRKPTHYPIGRASAPGGGGVGGTGPGSVRVTTPPRGTGMR